jgi:hypothetical protein
MTACTDHVSTDWAWLLARTEDAGLPAWCSETSACVPPRRGRGAIVVVSISPALLLTRRRSGVGAMVHWGPRATHLPSFGPCCLPRLELAPYHLWSSPFPHLVAHLRHRHTWPARSPHLAPMCPRYFSSTALPGHCPCQTLPSPHGRERSRYPSELARCECPPHPLPHSRLDAATYLRPSSPHPLSSPLCWQPHHHQPLLAMPVRS